MDRFLTTAEVAQLLRQPESTVRYWRYLGKGPPSVKVGRRVLYPQDGLGKWLAGLEKAERQRRL